MHSSTLFKASAAALLMGLFATEAVAKVDAGHNQILGHRRHHARTNRRRGTCKSGGSSSSSSSSSSTSSTDTGSSTDAGTDTSSGNSTIGGSSSSTGTNATHGSISGLGLTSSLLANSDVFVGFLPDGGDAGGTRETMAQINSAIGAKSAAYGWYAQAHSGTTFTGDQLTQVIEDVKACNCVFQPAVMPVGGWQGLTSSDNSQAVAIAKVMAQFTSQGIPVWLRFAHEMNYYQTDGTYQGNAQDFKQGWAAVAAAVRQYAPQTLLWWTPNVSSMSNYAEYEPDNWDDVDLVGVDFYPKSLSSNTFVNTMQQFHDTYAVGKNKPLAQGETGLGYAGSMDDRLSWLQQIIAAKSQLPKLTAVSWFNYQKGYDFRVVLTGGGGSNGQFVSDFVKS